MQKILEKYEQYLRQNYSSKNTRVNYSKYAKNFLKWLNKEKGKTYDQLTPEDTKDYKAYCLAKFKPNGNVGRLNGVNNFVDEFLDKPELRISAPKSVKANKKVLNEKELQQYIDAAQTPLEKLIVVYEVDGLLRPGEFPQLKISNHDLVNQRLYLDNTKTGNNHIILTPRMEHAYKEYLKVRPKPKDPKDNDKLIIIPKGSHIGKPIQDGSNFVYRRTKEIAANTRIQRSVYPYLIKPSSITQQFNDRVNPTIIKRQARHRKIETTLLYDHSDEQMVKDHYNKLQNKQPNTDHLDKEDEIELLYKRYKSGEIDPKTFKRNLDVLFPDQTKPQATSEDYAYM